MDKERCRIIQEKIDEVFIESGIIWVDEDMSQHIKVCKECREYIEKTRDIARMLSRFKIPKPDNEYITNFESRVLEKVRGIEFKEVEEDRIIKITKPKKGFFEKLREVFVKHPVLKARLGYGLAILAFVAVGLYFIFREFKLPSTYKKDKYTKPDEPMSEIITPPKPETIDEIPEITEESDIELAETEKEMDYYVDKSFSGKTLSSDIDSEGKTDAGYIKPGSEGSEVVSADEVETLSTDGIIRESEELAMADSYERKFIDESDDTIVEESSIASTELTGAGVTEKMDYLIEDESIKTLMREDIQLLELSIYAVYDPINPPDPLKLASEDEYIYEVFENELDHSILEIEDVLIDDIASDESDGIYRLISSLDDEEAEKLIEEIQSEEILDEV
jgi:hypothetical protein